MRSMTMELADGRRLSWAELGSEDATNVLVANHGTGSSRLELAIYDEVLGELGLRVLRLSVPDTGSRHRCIGPAASPNGRPVSSSSSMTSESRRSRCRDSREEGHTHSPSRHHRLSRRVSRDPVCHACTGTSAPQRTTSRSTSARINVSWQEFVDWYESEDEQPQMSPADQEAFAAPPYLEAAMATITEGTPRQGPAGGASDRWAFATPWGFEHGGRAARRVWHGDADTQCPSLAGLSRGRRCHARLLRILPGEGHFSIGRHVPDLLPRPRERLVRRRVEANVHCATAARRSLRGR